jgi:hypothetical protein
VKLKPKYIIIDWTSNVCFGAKEFDSFDDAEAFLSETLGDDYESDRQDYYIESGVEIQSARYLDPLDPRSGLKSRGAK